MHMRSVAMVLGLAVMVASPAAYSQGLPDILWESSTHTHSVEAVAYSPDGTFVASGGSVPTTARSARGAHPTGCLSPTSPSTRTASTR